MVFKGSEDFPGGTVDRNPLPIQGTRVHSLVWEDSMFPQTLSPCARTREAWAPGRLEPVPHNKRRHHNEKPAHHNQRVALTHHNQRKAHTAKKTQHSQK